MAASCCTATMHISAAAVFVTPDQGVMRHSPALTPTGTTAFNNVHEHVVKFPFLVFILSCLLFAPLDFVQSNCFSLPFDHENCSSNTDYRDSPSNEPIKATPLISMRVRWILFLSHFTRSHLFLQWNCYPPSHAIVDTFAPDCIWSPQKWSRTNNSINQCLDSWGEMSHPSHLSFLQHTISLIQFNLTPCTYADIQGSVLIFHLEMPIQKS